MYEAGIHKKRINKKTNQEFKEGDIRDDGKIFFTYVGQEKTVDGYVGEYWGDREQFLRRKIGSSISQVKIRSKIKNIQFIEAVCTDSDGEMLGFDGDLDHTDFQKNPTECKITATTLDIIINEAGRPSIGFVHVDVEGLELPVLIGASQIIDRDRPIISFEQHISREDVGMVKEFLFSFISTSIIYK